MERPLILNVNDHEPGRFLYTRILRRAGYDVVEAGSAVDVQQVLDSGVVPDLALLDVGLPDQDGVTLCAELKAAHPKLCVVMMSATHRSQTDLRESFQAGAEAFLSQPLEPERLLDTIREVLAHGRIADPK